MENLNTNKSIKEYQEFIDFLESLLAISKEKWVSPIAENKWCVRDIIGHIMIWDKYILENAISKIEANLPVTIENVDIDNFNKKAVDYVRPKSKEDIIIQSKKYRRDIIELIKNFPEEKLTNNYVDSSGNNFSILSFLVEFIEHDKHHKKQIEEFFHSF